MTRLLVAFVIVSVIAVLAFLAMAFESRMSAMPTEHVETTSETTSTTRWLETLPALPSGFDPLTLTPTTRRAKVKARHAGSIWDAIAACESGGDWADTRGGYEGGVHFLHSTWVQAGGRKYAEHAYEATREQQIDIAQSWLERTSWEQWPVCSRKVGAR